MIVRLIIVAALVAAVLVADRLYRRWRTRDGARPARVSALPPALFDGAPRTWVVFTTPYCVACGPLADLLRRSDPDARVVTVDATVDSNLAREFAVRSAPTTVLADAEGAVLARFVGTEPVRRHLSSYAGGSIR